MQTLTARPDSSKSPNPSPGPINPALLEVQPTRGRCAGWTGLIRDSTLARGSARGICYSEDHIRGPLTLTLIYLNPKILTAEFIVKSKKEMLKW
jgi:hypothetical protein